MGPTNLESMVRDSGRDLRRAYGGSQNPKRLVTCDWAGGSRFFRCPEHGLECQRHLEVQWKNLGPGGGLLGLRAWLRKVKMSGGDKVQPIRDRGFENTY